MSIHREIFLRYRAPGHARFSLPAVLCQPAAANRLIAGLKQTQGIYRVDLYRGQRKLSIRYIDGVGDFHDLAAAIRAVVAEIESTPPAPPFGIETGLTTTDDTESGITGWVKAKYQEFRETVTAMGIVARNAVSRKSRAPSSQNNYVSEFFIDVLVLYLIKAHWHLITQHWLKRPWQYRYEWMAALYMIYLLVRSKRPKS